MYRGSETRGIGNFEVRCWGRFCSSFKKIRINKMFSRNEIFVMIDSYIIVWC